MAAIFLVRYRRPSDEAPRRQPSRAPTHCPAVLDELGVLVGCSALFLVWWVIGFRQYVRLRVAPDDALEVYVTAKQWMWKFAYPDGQPRDRRALRAGRPPGQADDDLARRHPQLLRARRSA